MKNHTVYFEFFGKKMKTQILAKDQEDAKQKIKEKIKFEKIVADTSKFFDDLNDHLNRLKGIF